MNYFLNGPLAVIYSALLLISPFLAWVIYTLELPWSHMIWPVVIAWFATLGRLLNYDVRPTKNFPSAGDGIVITKGERTDKHHIVRSRLTHSITKELLGVVIVIKGKEYNVMNEAYRQETFIEHITRPTGFGRTSWLFMALVNAIFVWAMATNGTDWWMPLIAVMVVDGAVILGTWMNYARRWV